MVKRKGQDKDIIFALDIGTRSIIGIVGKVEDERFQVLAIEREEHSKRAMLDGQIEDISQVAKVARKRWPRPQLPAAGRCGPAAWSWGSGPDGSVLYRDVLGLEHTVAGEQLQEVVRQPAQNLAQEIAQRVLSLNGAPPSALFLACGPAGRGRSSHSSSAAPAR